jgi:hypothetical protein
VCPAVKLVGKPDAGNRHVRFDERGRETGRCRTAQATAPFLDSTNEPPLEPVRIRRVAASHSKGAMPGLCTSSMGPEPFLTALPVAGLYYQETMAPEPCGFVWSIRGRPRRACYDGASKASRPLSNWVGSAGSWLVTDFVANVADHAATSESDSILAFTGLTPTGFVGARCPQEFLNVRLDQVEPDISAKLLAPLVQHETRTAFYSHLLGILVVRS